MTAQFVSGKKPCWKDDCVQVLNQNMFQTIIATCPRKVGMHHAVTKETRLKISDNLGTHFEWSGPAFLLGILFLFISLLYNPVTGRIVRSVASLIRWIRTGTW